VYFSNKTNFKTIVKVAIRKKGQKLFYFMEIPENVITEFARFMKKDN
jgi:hypothetical protein